MNALELQKLGGEIYAHNVGDCLLRVVYYPKINELHPVPVQELSSHGFDHAFSLLTARLMNDEKTVNEITEKYLTIFPPGIGIPYKSVLDRLLLSRFIHVTLCLHVSGGSIVAQFEWHGTKDERPGNHVRMGYGETVSMAIANGLAVLRNEAIGKHHVSIFTEEKEPVS